MNLSSSKLPASHLYLQVYEHYKEEILTQRLSPGTKMPSLRRCSQELGISRTTVESAYLQLAADGYLISRPQSGYYVTEIARNHPRTAPAPAQREPPVLYNFAGSGVDRESFSFNTWRRYIKSALRQNERLLSYGEPQGEADLRQALCDYIREKRNVICSPDDIVVGAGVQSLLHILCPLIRREKRTVSFPTSSFYQGIQVFSDYDFDVHFRDKSCDVIYVSPAHMTKWGEIMPVSRRMELVRHAARQESLIIEDDFENEFVYLQKPTPSLYSLSGEKNVIYIGSFSKLLLPSIRLSFMVLPPILRQRYQKVGQYYNQTASKAEQIALCQYIRDGHLSSQIRRLRRLYSEKMKRLVGTVYQVFGAEASVRVGASGMSLLLNLPYSGGREMFLKEAGELGIKIEVLEEHETQVSVILSCSAMPSQEFLPGCEMLSKIIRKDKKGIP